MKNGIIISIITAIIVYFYVSESTALKILARITSNYIRFKNQAGKLYLMGYGSSAIVLVDKILSRLGYKYYSIDFEMADVPMLIVTLRNSLE